MCRNMNERLQKKDYLWTSPGENKIEMAEEETYMKYM
jgi:hypothetical protein